MKQKEYENELGYEPEDVEIESDVEENAPSENRQSVSAEIPTIQLLSKKYDERIEKMELLEIIEALHSSSPHKVEDAQMCFVYKTEGLVIKILHQNYPTFVQSAYFPDLYQVAYQEILKCLPEYDPRKGRLTTFVNLCVRRGVGEYLAEEFGITRYYSEKYREIRAAQEQLKAKGQDPKSVVAIRELTGLPNVTVLTTLKMFDNAAKVGFDPDDEGMFADHTANPEDEYIEKEKYAVLYRALASLPEIQRKILYAEYGLDQTPRNIKRIASSLGISIAEVRRHREIALTSLRNNHELRTYMQFHDACERLLGDIGMLYGINSGMYMPYEDRMKLRNSKKAYQNFFDAFVDDGED